MIMIYGWLKERRPLKQVLASYCYVCQRNCEWHVWRESEWVTFFGMRTIPFLSKDSLACARCEGLMPLQKAQSRELLRGAGVAQAIEQLEAHQLEDKNEVQRNFLRANRAAREQGA